MKKFLSVCLLMIALFAFSGCGNGTNGDAKEYLSEKEEETCEENRICLKIGESKFTANAYENETARAFRKMLPMTMETDAAAHEKYFYLPNPLPSNPRSVKRIEAGDIMLWGDNCLVLFYESFDTPYRYTPVAKITDVSGLADCVGVGGVTIEVFLSEYEARIL